jgi:manganese transport protein
VTDIREAHQLLNGALGSTIAATLFAVALLASGQNATITGTLAGQIVLEGFLKIKGKAWMVRTFTRLAALVPALLVIAYAGEAKAVELLLWSQVILSLQLGFACWPLVSITTDPKVMGQYLTPKWVGVLGALATIIVVSASFWFVKSVI